MDRAVRQYGIINVTYNGCLRGAMKRVEPLAIQRCIQLKRVCDRHSITVEENSFYMYLYQEKIIAGQECFPLQDIFDISYYPHHKTGETLGFLYLHTKCGVKTYYIKELPVQFVEAFKRLTTNPS